MSAIYKLIDSVEAAVREYDRSSDHLKHGANSDCVRCALVAALPPAAQDRLARSKKLSTAVGAPVEVVREDATDSDALLRRALPLLVKLGDFIGNGAIDPKRADSLGERCDLTGDIKATLGDEPRPTAGAVSEIPGRALAAWLRHRNLPVRNLSGPTTPAKLLASPDSLRPSERDWLVTFSSKYGANIEAVS